MPQDGLQWFEAALGAVSKISGEEGEHALTGARCPKCDASDFVPLSDLYSESRRHLEDESEPPETIRAGGLTAAQIVAKFTPPRRTSALGIAFVAAVPLGCAAGYLYYRFGETVGQISIAAAVVFTAMILMTSLRKFSDQFYHRRRKWNRTFMCKQCGQLVGS